MKQSHDVLTAPIITCVSSRQNQPYRVRLQKLAGQQLIARGRDCQGLEDILNVNVL